MSKTLDILSLGAGVQSSTMLYMVLKNKLPRPDAVIFADTRWEPQAVYKHLRILRQLCQHAEIPFLTVSAGNIRTDTVNNSSRFASLPLHIRNRDGKHAMLRRQCTYEYKILPIQRAIKNFCGVARPRRPIARLWIGISLDEVTRMKPSRVKYIVNHYPLIDEYIRRSDCLRWIEQHGFPIPPKSSCLGCPFHDDVYWRMLKNDSPIEFQDAVEYDRSIRTLLRIEGNAFLHRSLQPLDLVDLRNAEEKGQINLFENECTGHCGI